MTMVSYKNNFFSPKNELKTQIKFKPQISNLTQRKRKIRKLDIEASDSEFLAMVDSIIKEKDYENKLKRTKT